MKSSFPFLGLKSFRHGIHPDERKEETDHLPIERMPFVGEYVLPLSQHLGAPSLPIVNVGQRVKRGDMIAKPAGYISTALHTPVTGTVKEIGLRPHPTGKTLPAIVIRTDPYASQRWVDRPVTHPDQLPNREVVRLVQEAGIVGLGGAAFPSHVKLQVPEGKKIEYYILNGCECEPFLTCDHRIMVERADAILHALRFMMRQVDAEAGFVGIEVNKPDAIEKLTELAKQDTDISIVPLKVKYPQGAEKMLIDAVWKRQVPAGKLPMDVSVMVNNVGTAVAVHDLWAKGLPLIERVVTIRGTAIPRPKNLMIPLGTPIREVLGYCGADLDNLRQLIMGGPMMGMAQKNLDAPVIKGTSGLLGFTESLQREVREHPCIRCGRCLDACPMLLNPSRLAMLVNSNHLDQLDQYHLMDCIECGSCSFTCPSHIPLVQLIRHGKALIRQKKRTS